MIPGPIPQSQSPVSPQVALLLDGVVTYPNRAAYRAANPAAPELPPCDPSIGMVVNYDMSAVPAQYRSPSGACYSINLAKPSVDPVGPFPLNLPNDSLTFPAWQNSPETQATVQQNPETSSSQVNVAQLCLLSEAQFVVATLKASGFAASDPVDLSLGTPATYSWGAEARRPWGSNIQGYSGPIILSELYGMIADKAQGNAGGVGAPGTFHDPLSNGIFQWVPQPPPKATILPPARNLVPPEFLGSVLTGLFYSVMLQVPAAQQSGTGTGLSAADEAAIQEIPEVKKELDALLNAERVPIPD